MTIGIYIRVSTHEQAQEGYSISAQKERLIAYCQAQGWTNYKFYVDEGVSAKDTNRPQLNLLFDQIKKRQVNMILVYRLDRFTRRVVDLHKMLEEMEKYNCAFKSATEPYDTSTAMGRMFIGLVALLAQWEAENLSERVKMALEEKVAGGERVGGIPYGFDLNDEEKLVANEKAEVVLDMIEKTKSGMSANAIANYLTKTNSDKAAWHPTTVYRILQNPALYGATRWNDRIFENTHTGIITKKEFDKIQMLLHDRKVHRIREVETTYLFQGKLSCPVCKNVMRVNRNVRKRKDGSPSVSIQYRCMNCYQDGNGVTQVGETRLVEALYEFMKTVTFTDFKQEEIKDETAKYREQLQKVEKVREKYTRSWAMDKMTDNEYNKLMDESRVVYEELKSKLENTEAPAEVDTEAFKNIVSAFNEHFYFLSHEEKRIFVSRFIRRIDFQLIPQPPKEKKYKKGLNKVVITDVLFL